MNVAVINNILQVLKIESMRIQQLASNVPQFNLYYWKRISVFLNAYKIFLIEMTVFLFFQEVYLPSKKKISTTFTAKMAPTQCYS